MTSSTKKPPDLRNRMLINGFSAFLLAIFIFFAEMPIFRYVFTAFVAVITAVALWEFYGLAKRKGLSPAAGLGVVISILYIFAAFIKTQGPFTFARAFWHVSPEIILGIALLGCFVYYAYNKQPSIANIATTFFGIVYIVIPLGLIVRIAYFFLFDGKPDPHFEGSFWLAYLLIVTKSADMGGYFVGSYFGKRKLAQSLSPNKTLEGAFGGLVASIALSLLIIYLGRTFWHVFQDFSYTEALVLGVLIGIVGQVGDLAESLLKRDAGVKDSNVFPGVGGVLDMVDSLLFTSPLVYIILRMHYT